MLYKDVCKGDISDVIALLRARQLGELNDNELNELIDGRRGDVSGIVSAYRAAVEQKLPNFQKETSGGDNVNCKICGAPLIKGVCAMTILIQMTTSKKKRV